MKNALIPNEKQIVKGIVSAFNKMESAKKGYVFSVIELGERLMEAKENVPHGQWISWLKANSEFVFDERQAQKYILVASNKLLVLEYFSDENSVNQLTKAISEATPEQLAKVAQIEAEHLAAEEKAKSDKAAKAAELEAKRAEEQTIARVQTKDPEIIEGDFKEVKPVSSHVEKPEEVKTGFVQIEAEKMEEIEDSLHELASLNKSISKDNDSMVKIFDANDQLGAAVKEIKRLNDLNTSLEGRLNGFMNERNALIKEAKYWRSKFEKLEKANAK